MAEEDVVSGEGWISDDSSFYGDEVEQRHQSQLSRNFRHESFWHTHQKDLDVITNAARMPEPPSEKLTSGIDPAVEDTSFTMSGVDHKAMEQERLARLGKRKREPSPIPPHELFNPLEGQEDAWQLGEPVDDFIRRLPPYTTAIFTCPWIWAANPHRNPRD
ncbi:hypothetical protein G6011_03880 [Alternaria panax]|uniref:Uncharacterized protein n=1 Tax=Alternaria panax TaxID=48097 RepID=A0AAD4IFV5_9PLEO|nr:hypothetical protein G6011_03880 [Alternaria panax]